ncbi:MAG: glycosyltransferase family 4 protein [Gammaproteobacteria bacterium]
MTATSIIGEGSGPRVLLIANTAWYLRNFRRHLIERLEAHGFSVILASPPDARTGTEFYTRRHFEPLRLSRKGRNPLHELPALIRLIRLLRRVHPDAVLTWTPKPNIYAAIAARWLGIPVVPNVSGLGAVFIRGGVLAGLVGVVYRVAFSRAACVFFQNEEDRAAFVAAGWVSAGKAQRLPGSGVDLTWFAPQPITPRPPFVFLFIGRLLADKGLGELVEAARRLRRDGQRFELQLAGFLDPGNPAGITQKELDGWVQAREVNYLGAFDDVRPALAAAHCVVLPSYREGVPRSLLEAAASARAVIATDVPGCRDAVLPGVSGYLCPARDAGGLAACMRKMLDLAPQALSDMGRAGRAHVEEHFSEERVLDAYLRLCMMLRQGALQSGPGVRGPPKS